MKLKPFIVLMLIAIVTCSHKTPTHTESTTKVEYKLKGTSWSIRPMLCLDESVTLYTLTKPKTANPYLPYGEHVSFVDDTHFHSYYTTPYGDDCFTDVHGYYRLLSEDKIAIRVDYVTYSQVCNLANEYRKGQESIFTINKTDSTLTLRRE